MDFRDMNVLMPGSLVPGVVYVMWVKPVGGNWKSEDIIYAIVHKANSRFGHQDFKYVCETVNGNFFVTNKICDGVENPTWQECLDELPVLKAPYGNPLYLIDKAYTFVEVAKIAYEKGLFLSKPGLQHISKRTQLPITSVLKQLTGPVMSDAAMLATAKEASEKLDNVKTKDSDVLPIAPFGLLPGASGTAALITVRSESPTSEEDRIIQKAVVESWKDKAMFAESKYDALEEEKKALEDVNAELNVKLKSSLEHQDNFMVAGDKANMSLKSLNLDTASEVTKALEPNLSLIGKVSKDVMEAVSKMNAIATFVDSLPQKITAGVKTLLDGQASEQLNQYESLFSRIGTVHDSLDEGVTTTNDVLHQFGLSEGENGVDIPSAINKIVEGFTNSRDENLESETSCSVSACFFQERQKVAVYVCKCGCKREVFVEPTAEIAAEEHGDYGEMEELFVKEEVAVLSQVASNADLSDSLPATSQLMHTPVAKNEGHYVNPQPRLTRAQKRKQKNKSFLSEKKQCLNFDDSDQQQNNAVGSELSMSGMASFQDHAQYSAWLAGQRQPSGHYDQVLPAVRQNGQVQTDPASATTPRPSAPRQSAPRHPAPMHFAPRQPVPRQPAPRQHALRHPAPRHPAPGHPNQRHPAPRQAPRNPSQRQPGLSVPWQQQPAHSTHQGQSGSRSVLPNFGSGILGTPHIEQRPPVWLNPGLNRNK